MKFLIGLLVGLTLCSLFCGCAANDTQFTTPFFSFHRKSTDCGGSAETNTRRATESVPIPVREPAAEETVTEPDAKPISDL